jgi:hypothetical protein
MKHVLTFQPRKAVLTAWLGLFLLGCNSPNPSADQPTTTPASQAAEPTVLTTTRYYAQLLTPPSPPVRHSLLRYLGRPFQPDIVPERYLLRLRAYTVIVRPDSLAPAVIIEPAERTALYHPALAGTASRPTRPSDTIRVDATPRQTNPTLAILPQELTEGFGPWDGDVYIQEEEPMQPEMHLSTLYYQNPTSRRRCRIFVHLKNAPGVVPNAVHDIELSRTAQP